LRRFGSVFRWVECVRWRPWSRRPYRRCDDGLEQVRPVLEDNIGGDSPQVLEEAVCGAARDDGCSPGDDTEVSGGVEREGQQIEGDQNTGKGFLAVSKVVPKVVSVGLEHVEGLVFDLPAGAATGGQFGNAVASDGEIGDEAVVIGSLPLALRISMKNQLTRMASSVARSGTAESQR
jgi:hypothetical protein